VVFPIFGNSLAVSRQEGYFILVKKRLSRLRLDFFTHTLCESCDRMAEGKIKRLTDKGFGFIETGTGEKDMFFHSSNVEGASFDQLREGQRVTYTPGRGPKGPRAENVRPI
jgi:cold shock protein